MNCLSNLPPVFGVPTGGYLWLLLCSLPNSTLLYSPWEILPSAEGFFEAYLSFPLVMVMYIGHKIYKRNWKLFIPAEKMDIDTGRREVDLDLLKQEIAEEKAIMATKPRWYRIWNFWC